MTSPRGLDVDALASWWPEHVGPVEEGLVAERIAGGKSNLTYRVRDGARSWVLRRPPLGHVLATAHDMAREHRVVAALGGTDVPVPHVHALCADDAVLGATFYVMEDVPGTAYRTAEQLAPLGPERTRAVAERLVDTLVALHSVDPAEVGLGDFGRPDGFLTRQVGRWHTQLQRSHSRDLPAADELHRRLEAAVPEAERLARPGIVHGDYRLDNVLVESTDGDDRLRAVVDWEMATLGDTLTDVALMVVYGRLADLVPGVVADATSAPGYSGEDELLDRYAAARDVDPGRLGFHLGLAAYKLVGILEGIHYRHQQGQTVGEGFDGIGDAVHPLLDAGLAAVRRA